MGAWIADAEGSYTEPNQERTPEGDWTFFARALIAARVYECPRARCVPDQAALNGPG
ncbi:hypothetical protein [Streptomyces sp. NPDC058155]|uniref:DUF7660 family protein n=1 Tax=Streptomyces sp. NPDC058155 TaxID=3346359 RepID=UPI0036E91FE6